MIFYVIEFAILLIAFEVYGFLLFYTCITIGQTAKKARIGKAIGVYFIYYGITQVLGTIFIILSVALEETSFMISILDFALYTHSELFIHLLNCGIFVLVSAVSLVFFLICRSIMTKKLNVE